MVVQETDNLTANNLSTTEVEDRMLLTSPTKKKNGKKGVGGLFGLPPKANQKMKNVNLTSTTPPETPEK